MSLDFYEFGGDEARSGKGHVVEGFTAYWSRLRLRLPSIKSGPLWTSRSNSKANEWPKMINRPEFNTLSGGFLPFLVSHAASYFSTNSNDIS